MPSGIYERTAETKRNISLAKRGIKLTEEHKQKLREDRLGKKNHFYGGKHTLESREKNAEGTFGYKVIRKHKEKIK